MNLAFLKSIIFIGAHNKFILKFRHWHNLIKRRVEKTK